jgi:hypothetical protein
MIPQLRPNRQVHLILDSNCDRRDMLIRQNRKERVTSAAFPTIRMRIKQKQ